ncbi:MAG TPA: orotate phosphoribosyltransferase [Trueperaceae bacterium]|nr:orotate phosphoribosyltransferase [Trueperaceae bacterium]
MTEGAASMDILETYRRTGAMRTGHFLLASGGHTDRFFQSATVMQFPDAAQTLGRAIAEKWAEEAIDFVIGPAMGGVVLAAVTAQFLGVRALFAEKAAHGESMFIRPGMTVRQGERFLAVEDVVTTGGSVTKAIRAAEAAGAVCVGVSSVIDRNDGATPFAYPYRPLATLTVITYDPEDCPLCRRGVPLEKI